MYYPQYVTNLMMGCGNSTPAPAGPGNSPVLKKNTMTGLQQHAGTLATPGDSKQITHQILGTDNSDSVSIIDITEITGT